MATLIYLPDTPQKSLDIPLNNRAEEFSRNRPSLDWFTSTLQPLKFSHLSQRHSLPSSSSSSGHRIALCKPSLLSPLFNSSQLQPAQLPKPQDLDSTPVCPQRHSEFCVPSEGLLYQHCTWESVCLSRPPGTTHLHRKKLPPSSLCHLQAMNLQEIFHGKQLENKMPWGKCFKSSCWTRVVACATLEAKAGGWRAWDQLGLQSEAVASLDNLVRPYFKIKRNKGLGI